MGKPPSNLARGPISDQVGMAATGWFYTPPDIIKRQAMRANLLANATPTNFGGFRSSSEASHGVGFPKRAVGVMAARQCPGLLS